MVTLLKDLRRRNQEQTEEMRMQGMDQYMTHLPSDFEFSRFAP